MNLIFDNSGMMSRLTSFDGCFNISFDEASFNNIAILKFLEGLNIFRKNKYGSNELESVSLSDIMYDIGRYTDNYRRGFDGYTFDSLRKINEGFKSSFGCDLYSEPTNVRRSKFVCEVHLSRGGVESNRDFMIKDHRGRLIIGITINKKNNEYKRFSNKIINQIGFTFSLNEILW